MERPPQLGDVLVSAGVISKQQLAQALEQQRSHGGMLGQTLVAIGACSEGDIRGALEAQKRNTPLAERLAMIKGREAASGDGSWHSVEMLDREVRRIGQDIRDLSLVLSELSLGLEGVRAQLASNPDAATTVLSRQWEQLRRIIRGLDGYATELAPPWLEGGQLLTLFRQYSGHYHRCYAGTMEVRLSGEEPRTSHRAALGVFRALQCLLRGVGEGAGRRDLTLVLGFEGDDVIIEVSFEEIHAPQGSTGDPVGESEERVRLFGGHVDRSQAGDRVNLVYHIPCGPITAAPPGSAMVVE